MSTPADNVRDVKISQDQAAYGPAYEPGVQCGTCAHFDGVGTCELVDGPIDPTMVSDLYEPAQGPGGEPMVGGGPVMAGPGVVA
jgi:hypothetical protein